MSITNEELQEGRRIAALVVRHCGDRYLPVFERFDKALEERTGAQQKIDEALRSERLTLRSRRRQR